MLQKLKNEDLNSQKIALCKKNNILCKQMACDESTLVKGVYYWNTLRKEEKEKLLNEIGRSLTPIIADRISALTQNDKTSKDINAVCQEQAQTKFKKEKKPRAEIESQKVDFDEASRDDRTLNLLSVFDLILDWKAGAQSKSCHSFVRLMLRVLNEKSSKDLLADLGCCLVVSKFFADRLFLGQKAVVSYTLLGDLGLAVLEAIGSSIVDQTSLENDCHKLALSIPEKTEHTASIKVKKVDSHSNAEKNKRSSKLIEEIEGSLFTFAVMFENRLLEMVNYHEVFFGANQGKLFNMMPYMQTERDVYDPDRVVCRFQLPLNNKNIGKNKPLPENQRLFKVRRAIRRIQTERIIGNQSDYMMFQAFSFQNGYSYQISPPENAILSIRVSKEIQEFKLMLNIVKKPTNNRNQGHNYNYGNGHGYRGHNMRSFNPQFGNFLASQYHGKGNYGMGYGQNGGREHISNSR